ncbi:MAG: phage head closure protein [Alphaproteobacteria bacterium]
MDVRAGALRHRVALQSAVETADGGGGFGVAWSDVATVWAAIEPLKGTERLRAQRLENPVSHKVTIRYRGGVTAAMRLKFGTRIFDIRAVINPRERNQRLELLCEEGVGS